MKSNFGLRTEDIREISHYLKEFPEIEKCIIFGSRAKGSYKSGSDVDIALKGEKVTDEVSDRLNLLLNETSSMPYYFDVLNYNSISNEKLKEHIDRIGIEFLSY